jgi:hypothetical protein
MMEVVVSVWMRIKGRIRRRLCDCIRGNRRYSFPRLRRNCLGNPHFLLVRLERKKGGKAFQASMGGCS